MRVFHFTCVAVLLGTVGASAATIRAHAGFNPGAQVDVAYLGSVPVGYPGHGGASPDGGFTGKGTSAGGPVGGFADRN